MGSWEALYADEFWRRWAQRPPLPVTRKWMSELKTHGASRVYDMGCGLGRHALALAQLDIKVVASDRSPLARQATRDMLSAAGFRCEVIDADMTTIPFADGYFDGVLSLGVMEHNTRAGIEQAVSEIHRALRQGGELLASFLPRTRWVPKDDPSHDMVEDNTFRSYGAEQSIHHMVDEAELGELFRTFTVLSVGLETEEFEGVRSQELFIRAAKVREP